MTEALPHDYVPEVEPHDSRMAHYVGRALLVSGVSAAIVFGVSGQAAADEQPPVPNPDQSEVAEPASPNISGLLTIQNATGETPDEEGAAPITIPIIPSTPGTSTSANRVTAPENPEQPAGTGSVGGLLSLPTAPSLVTPRPAPVPIEVPEVTPPAPAPIEITPPAPAEAPSPERRVVFYYQGDDQWSSHQYRANRSNDGRIGPNGCGPTSMAIVISSLTNTTVTPIDMANYNMEHNYVTSSGSTYHEALYKGPKDFGLDTYSVEQSVEAIREITEVRRGMVIVNGTDQNPDTPATRGGHIFVIRGVTADGKLLLADPASRRNSDRPVEPEDVFGPARIAIAVVNPNLPAEPAPAPAPEPAPPAPVVPSEIPVVPDTTAPSPGPNVLPLLALAPAAPEAPNTPTAPDVVVGPSHVGSLISLGDTPEAEIAPAPVEPAPAPAPEVAPPAPAEAPVPSNEFPNFNIAAIPNDYGQWIVLAAKTYNLDPAILAAQLEAESSWSQEVIDGSRNSRTGAQGIAQFMPGTWPAHANDANGNGTMSPLEPADAIMAQGHFMRVLLDQLGHIPGDPYANALAGYNAGGGRVRQYNGVPPRSFADGETYNYVQKIMANADKYRM